MFWRSENEVSCASRPRPSSRGDSDKGKKRTQHAPTARMQAASRADEEGTAGVVDPDTGEPCQERSPLAPTRRPIGRQPRVV